MEIIMNTSPIDTTVIIPNWNGEKWLPACLDALHQQRYQSFRTLVVDNGSQDNSRELLKTSYSWVDTILLPENRGFASAVNAGIRASHTEYLVLLNNDTIPSKEWLLNLHTCIRSASPDVGSLASCMVMMDDPLLIDDTGDILNWFGLASKRGHSRPKTEYTQPAEVFSACAGAALYRWSALMKTGLFDEKFESYLEDVDLGLRLCIVGYRCLYVPDAIIMHKGHGSGIKKKKYIINMTRNRLLLFLKNIPISLIIRNAPYLIAGQLWCIREYKNIIASCLGYISFIGMIPSVIHDHRIIKKQRILTKEQIQSLLTIKKTT